MILRLAAAIPLLIYSMSVLQATRADSPLPKESSPEDGQEASPSHEEKEATKKNDAEERDEVSEEKQLPWAMGLEEGLDRAKREGRPVLVLFEGAFCPWCVKLKEEIKLKSVQAELKRWTLVIVPTEKFPDDAQRLTVGPIPALRVLTARGTLVASRDGFIPAEDFIAWLAEQHQRASALPDDVLSSEGPPSLTDVVRLARLLGQRDQTLREAAIRRMLPFPATAASVVIQTLEDKKLATKLSALELLRDWNAPIDQLDPWRPETITPEHIAKLNAWASNLPQSPDKDSTPAAMSDEDRLAALADLSRLETASPEDAASISERLARRATDLLPEVRRRLQHVETDTGRERLTSLRYRLVASNSLALNWPGGMARLASRRTQDRHQALKELLERATRADEALLLELFSDVDPLMRELSLRGLQKVSGNTTSAAFLRLLDDPDPNVQAAVLKQLVESPDASFVPRLGEYLSQQKDPDLVTHALRVLSETKAPSAVAPLVSMLTHESWQVRAEAAEALGSLLSNRSSGDKKVESSADAYASLVERLSDDDAFVVSRAMEAVAKANLDLPEAVMPAIALAKQSPELAAKAVEFVVSKSAMRAKASGSVKDFVDHRDPKVRIAVIQSLSSAMSQNDASSQRYIDALGDLGELMAKWLASDERDVRIAAATELFEIQNQLRTQKFSNFESQDMTSSIQTAPTRSTTSIVLKGLGSLLGGSSSPVASGDESKPADDREDKKEGDDIDKESKTSDDTENADSRAAPWEKWLLDHRKWHSLAAWMATVDEPLKRMVRSEDVEEQVAAALPLIALGNVEDSLKLLITLTKKQHSVIDRAIAALPWLLWEDRANLFKMLLEEKPDASDYYQLIHRFAEIPDPRATDLLWAAAATAPSEAASVLGYIFPKLYFGQQYYDPSQIPASVRRRGIETVKTHIDVENPPATLLALNLISSADSDEAAKLAVAIMDDKRASPELRADALRIRLLTSTTSVATSLAVALIVDENNAIESDAIRRVSLRYLALGSEGINSALDGHLHLSARSTHIFRQSGVPIVIEPPAGLKAEDVMPLVSNAEDDDVAMAEYLLIVLGKAEHLERVIGHWHDQHRDDREWRQLTYRAIAAADDASQVPVLREIYPKIPSYELNDFYWTIRTMTGAEVLAFRKQIRAEKNIFGN